MKLTYTEKHSKDVRFSIRVTRQLYSRQSKFQKIDVMESREFGRFLTLDGLMMVTEKDEFIYHEMIVHMAMATNPEIKNVLVIGGGDGGTVRELCATIPSAALTWWRSTNWWYRPAKSI